MCPSTSCSVSNRIFEQEGDLIPPLCRCLNILNRWPRFPISPSSWALSIAHGDISAHPQKQPSNLTASSIPLDSRLPQMTLTMQGFNASQSGNQCRTWSSLPPVPSQLRHISSAQSVRVVFQPVAQPGIASWCVLGSEQPCHESNHFVASKCQVVHQQADQLG